MKWRHSIPLTVVAVVGLAGIALVLVAMLATDQGEETLHLYKSIRALNNKNTTAPVGSGMELIGRWQGMSVAPADSATARSMGVREAESGVVVVDMGNQGNEPARAAGLTLGDRITAIDNKPIRTMADMYKVAQAVNPSTPALIEVRRGNLPMTLVMPATAPAGTRPGEAPEGAAGVAPAAGIAPAAGAGLQAAWTANGQFYCPREGLLLPSTSVGPGMRCPRCQGPLQPYRTWP